ncbi:MAG: hypothetical protein CMO81_01735 [Waddliaceae bacterium]|nr:hypothetical protein [Waddliaceae bacterium]
MWKLNTSNKGKLAEFQRLFSLHGESLEISQTDLAEIDADPVQVVVHKASSLDEHVLVEDTSLDVEGGQPGIYVKWFLENLSEFVGRNAVWRVLLAYREGEQVYVFKGEVEGTIVESRGIGGFGFDPHFLPKGANKTLAEEKPNRFSARAKAVEALSEKEVFRIEPLMLEWNGPWQEG